MASNKILIVAVLAACFSPNTQGALLPESSAKSATTASIEIDVALSITALISPPDVQSAIQLLRNNSNNLAQFVQAAIANISTDATTNSAKFKSFLSNLKTSINSDSQELEDELKTKLIAAIQIIQSFLDKESQDLGNLPNNLNQSVEEIEAKVAQLNAFLKAQLAKLSLALNQSESFILPIIRKELNQAIVILNATLSNPSVQKAIVRFVVSNLQGPLTLTLTNLLTGLSTALLATGSPVLAGLAAALPALAVSLPAILGPILSTTITIGLGLLLG